MHGVVRGQLRNVIQNYPTEAGQKNIFLFPELKAIRNEEIIMLVPGRGWKRHVNPHLIPSHELLKFSIKRDAHQLFGGNQGRGWALF